MTQSVEKAELFALAGIEPVVRGGLCLLEPEQVTRLLPLLRERDVVVLGIEGFRVTPNYIEPRMDQIADFSSIMDLPPDKRSETSIHEAQAFFATAADRCLLFELALQPAA